MEIRDSVKAVSPGDRSEEEAVDGLTSLWEHWVTHIWTPSSEEMFHILKKAPGESEPIQVVPESCGSEKGLSFLSSSCPDHFPVHDMVRVAEEDLQNPTILGGRPVGSRWPR